MKLLLFAFVLLPRFIAGIDGSYYELLGVKQNAANKDIKKLYRKKSVALHPDKLIGSSPEAIAEAQNQFIEISKAYEVLTNSIMRKRYDHILSMGEKEYDHQRNWDWVDQQLGIKAMHHRQPGRAEEAGMRVFTFEEAERMFNQMREETEREDVLQSEDMPWPIAAALVASFAISVGVPLWLWTYKRRARQAEKEKKKAVNAENKARIVEQVRQQKELEPVELKNKKPTALKEETRPKKSGKVVFSRDDIAATRASAAQSILLKQVLLGLEDNVHDLNEFRSAAGIITAFRNWLVDLQLDEQKGCIEVEDGDNNEQLGLSAHLEYLECLLAVIDVHLGRASLADVWEQHFEDNSTVTETMDPAILSRFRLCAAQVVDNLSPVGVSFDSVLVELLGNLSNLVYQRTSDLFDDFASDAENLTALIAASITLRDCMDCKASRVRFEPHVHMEGFHADFELWELLQHLIDRIRKTTDAGEPFRSYCQSLVNQWEDDVTRAEPDLLRALKAVCVEKPAAESLKAIAKMASRLQTAALERLEDSYSRFQRGTVLVLGEEQQSKDMAKLVRELLKLVATDKEEPDAKRKKKTKK